MMDITAQYNRNDFLNFLSNRFLPDDFETADETVRSEKPNALDNMNFSIVSAAPIHTLAKLFKTRYTGPILIHWSHYERQQTHPKTLKRAEFGTKRLDFDSPGMGIGSLRVKIGSLRPKIGSPREGIRSPGPDFESLREEVQSPRPEAESWRGEIEALRDEIGSLEPNAVYKAKET
jgi:hypothetical protein